MKLVRYEVEIDSPKGHFWIDVPSMIGPDAAGRRAYITAVSMGWGDFDEVTVVSITPLEELA